MIGCPERVAKMKSVKSCDFQQKDSGGVDDIVAMALGKVGCAAGVLPRKPAFR